MVVPLVRKFDKRTNTEKYSISKKQYIKDKIHLSELQDKYHNRMVRSGFDLQRGIKNSDNVHLSMKSINKFISLMKKNGKWNDNENSWK